MKRFSINPLHHHCGPFNTVDAEGSEMPVDRVCQIHDIGYAEIQAQHGFLTPYVYQNKADDLFIKRASATGVAGKVYSSFFRGKRIIAPRLDESSSSLAVYSPPAAEKFMGDSSEKKSFSKKMRKVRSKRGPRRSLRKKRSRRRSKALKRVTPLQIFKAIGPKVQKREAVYQLLSGDFNLSSATANTNSEKLFPLLTLNDMEHYDSITVGGYGTTGSTIGNQVDWTMQQPYITRSYAKVTLSNMSNCDLVMTPIRLTCKFDVDTEVAYVGSGDFNAASYAILNQVYRLILASSNITTQLVLSAPATNLITSPYNPPSLEMPAGYPLPMNVIRKCFDVKVGKAFVLPVQGTQVVVCGGHKGAIPSPGRWSTTASAASGSLATPRVPIAFAKKTIMYGYIIRQKSHIRNATSSVNATQPAGDVNEFYLGGPFKVACDIQRVTDAVAVPYAGTYTQLRGAVNWTSYRPEADTAASVPYVMADTSETGSNYFSM